MGDPYYQTMADLIAAVLATGRLGGMAEAADLWCSYSWDAGATRSHTRMLRKQAQGNPVDEIIAEYVAEAVTLKLTLIKYGVKVQGPGSIEAWFKNATDAERRKRIQQMGAMGTVQPKDPDRFSDQVDSLKYLMMNTKKGSF